MQINGNRHMSQESSRDIRALSQEELQIFFSEQGRKAFHGKQVYEWLWKKGTTDFSQMTNLSREARKLLAEHFHISALRLDQQQESRDGTIKMAFHTEEGQVLESVLIPSGKRATACISSQIGCKLACTFCATGKIPFKRNLTVGEIYDQVTTLRETALQKKGLSLTNIVFMGMGEPLMNYQHVTGAIDMLCGDKGLGISPRRITISTVGIPHYIKKLADQSYRTELAVSLHSALDETRSTLVPINRRYGLEELKQALKYFVHKTGKRITFEYLMLKDINDSLAEARALADYSRNFPVKVNLIEYNEVEGTGYLKSPPEQVEAFKDLLESRNMIVNLRQSRGEDIDAACGQLAGKKGNQTDSPNH